MSKQPPKATPDPLVQEQREFWHDVGKEMIRKSIDTIDETAKQITGAVTILAGLYFNAITFSKLQGQVNSTPTLVVYLLPILLLLISLGASLAVFLPNRYPLGFHTSEASRVIFEGIANRKWNCLLISSMALLLSITSLTVAIFTYLRG